MKLKCKKGSLTIEAAFALPVVIVVILTIAYFIRIAYVHSLVQHALDESAKEISSYSYLYSVSKLQALNDGTHDLLTKNEASAVSRIDTVLETVNSVNDKIGKLGSMQKGSEDMNLDEIKGVYSSGKADIEKLKSIYNEIKGHPKGWKGGVKKEVASLASLVAHGLLESGREELSELIVRIMMRKHIATDKYDEDQALKRLNIMGGYEGLDFSGTSIFSDKKTIKLVVSYTIRPITPLPIIPELRIEQKALIVGWLDGDGKHSKRLEQIENNSQGNIDKEDNIWDLSPFDRGNEILRRFGANVLSRTGGAVDVFDAFTGTATDIRSIDITLSSYKDINNLKKEIKSEIKLVQGYNGKVRINHNGSETDFDIKSRNLRIIIPKGTKTAEITRLEAQLNSENSGVKLTIEEYIEKRAKES
ncbi:MAG TPA: TadE/TadG family type IV pilus assembly protein [Pseudobacteroides sp.]|uniref:TadE/TadG family type IV pilus assembly protein n=1 Tax=Pseudobacteroides sp. TaxID=1968840 RepID=UPI002F95A2BA